MSEEGNQGGYQNDLETNKNEFPATQNLWDTAKVILSGKFIAMQAYLKIIETSNKQPNPKPTKTVGTITKTAQSK